MSAEPESNIRPIVEASFRHDPDIALTQFRKFGFQIERRLVPEDVCDRLLSVAATRPSARTGTYAPIPMPHFDHPTFLAFMRFAPIVRIVEQIVGGTASGLGGEFFYMPPGAPGFAPHQDNFYVQAPPEAFISVWTALCEVEPANGGLIFYPESHHLGALPVRKGAMIENPGQNPGAQAVACLLPPNFPAIDIRLEKGSVIFFHSELAHASHANRSTRFRHSFLATYIRAGSPFRPGGVQQRREVSLHE